MSWLGQALRLLRELWREVFPMAPVAIPGKYPWSVDAENPLPYGTPLFEDDRFRHVADGCGGVVSQAKKRVTARIPQPRMARGRRAF